MHLKNQINDNKMVSSPEYIFRTNTVNAHVIKSLSEVLQSVLTDVCFCFDSEGIKLLTVDNKEPTQLLINLRLNAEAFDDYYCPKPISVGITIQHLYSMLKNIKKKDRIFMYITKKKPNYLGVKTTQPDIGQTVNSLIKIQKLSLFECEVPSGYSYPIHVSTNAYQRMCKDMQSVSNKISIYAKGKFLKFSCTVEGVFSKEFPFNEDLIESRDNEPEYTDTFYTKSLSQFIKISGLEDRMQIYPPPDTGKPLKISIKTDQLGVLEIYIKSVSQLDS